MDQEKNLKTPSALASAPNTEATEATKQDLTAHTEQARQSIKETVAQIKDKATNQYQAIADNVANTDWRQPARQRPLTFNLGALAAGFAIGYAIASTYKPGKKRGRSTSFYKDYNRATTTGNQGRSPASSSSNAYTMADYEAPPSAGPGIIDKLAGTQLFDRLQSEAAKISDQFINELSSLANNVVLPALTDKVKEVVGDSPSKQQGARQR